MDRVTKTFPLVNIEKSEWEKFKKLSKQNGLLIQHAAGIAIREYTRKMEMEAKATTIPKKVKWVGTPGGTK